MASVRVTIVVLLFGVNTDDLHWVAFVSLRMSCKACVVQMSVGKEFLKESHVSSWHNNLCSPD